MSMLSIANCQRQLSMSIVNSSLVVVKNIKNILFWKSPFIGFRLPKQLYHDFYRIVDCM